MADGLCQTAGRVLWLALWCWGLFSHSAASHAATAAAPTATACDCQSGLLVCPGKTSMAPEANKLRLNCGEVRYFFTGGAIAGPSMPVLLPDVWAHHATPMHGKAVYELRFDMPAQWARDKRWALYIPRAGNRYALSVNDSSVGETGDLEDASEDHVNTPYLWRLPEDLHPLDNRLRLEVRGELARNAGLSDIVVGPEATLSKAFKARLAWQQGGALLMVGVSLLIGLMAIGLGLAMGGATWWLFGLAAVFWACRDSYVLLVSAPLPHPWWGITRDWLYGATIALLGISLLNMLRIYPARLRWLLALSASSTALMPTVYGLTGAIVWREYWLRMLIALVAYFAALIVWRWWKTRSFNATVLMAAAVICLAFGLYDHVLVFWLPSGFSQFTLSRFAFFFLLLAVALLLLRKTVRVIGTAQRFRAQRHLRLAQAQHVLELRLAREEQQHIAQAMMQERLRIMRDMHDGLGAELVHLMGMVRDPERSAEDLEQQVQHVTQEMRASIEALQAGDIDWTGALVLLRSRIENRLHRADISLHWQVQDLPDLVTPTAETLKNGQLFLIEAVNNAIQHAHARHVTVAAHYLATDVTQGFLDLSVCDDGIGFDPRTTRSGLGLETMTWRAQKMAAQLQVTRAPRGTQVSLRIPVAVA